MKSSVNNTAKCICIFLATVHFHVFISPELLSSSNPRVIPGYMYTIYTFIGIALLKMDIVARQLCINIETVLEF